MFVADNRIPSVDRPPESRRRRWPRLALVSVALVGAALRVGAAWRPISDLLVGAVSDDAFYYFTIARNIVAGQGITFDGERVTNGFHPLWLAIVTGLAAIVPDRETLVHAALTVSALLGAATAVVIYAVIARLTGNLWAAVLGSAFYALHPYLITESVNGLETQLAVFAFAVTVLLFVRLHTSHPVERRHYLALGVATGLTVLARTDMALALAPMLVWTAVRQRAHTTSWLPGAVAAFAIVAPWLVWMLASFGTVIQVSGIAVPDFARQRFLEINGDAIGTQLLRSLSVTSQALFRQLPDLYFAPVPWLRLPVLAALALGVASMIRVPMPVGAVHRRNLRLLAPAAAGVLLTLLFHTAVRWHVREWYFAAVPPLVAMGLGAALARATWRRSGRGVALTYAGGVLVIAALYGPWQAAAFAQPLPHKRNMLETARWIAGNVPQDASIGSFNAGIFGYFSERKVVNLDGVVNEDAYRARKAGRMLEYVCVEAPVTHLVDVNISRQWNHVSCPGDDPCRSFETITTIGTKLGYLGGGQLDVLALKTSAGRCSELPRAATVDEPAAASGTAH
ncbi:MAG: glycosyltransferase family 39 protein [Vicinamibacterales bacterium]